MAACRVPSAKAHGPIVETLEYQGQTRPAVALPQITDSDISGVHHSHGSMEDGCRTWTGHHLHRVLHQEESQHS